MGGRLGARAFGVILALLWAVTAFAQDSFVRLSSFPTVGVADGSTPIVVTASVRDSRGNAVRDGTLVRFDTTLGEFERTVVPTAGGFARATIRANGLAGIATITARVIGVNAAPSTLDIEFVADRTLLDSAREYFEVVAPVYMQYTVDTRIVGAAASGQRVRFRYRDIEVRADDLQLSVNAYELRARNAVLTMGQLKEQAFTNLFIKLNTRRGIGTAIVEGFQADWAGSYGGITLAGTYANDQIGPPIRTRRLGLVEVRSDGIRPTVGPAPANAFTFQDLSESVSTVSARKVVIFPRREAQFHRARIYVAGNRLIELPLFQINFMTSNNSPLITDSIIGVVNNQLSINFPYFLSLEPGLTSLLRFRTGQVYGRGYQTVGGSFLDYELDWNKGDDMQGGLAVTGLFRDDWGLNVRQYSRFSQDTSAFVQLDVPAARGIFGSGSVSHQMGKYQASVAGNTSRSLKGLKSESQSFNASILSDPEKVGQTPIRFSYGLIATAQSTKSELFNQSQTGYGVRARAFANSVPVFDRSTRLSAEASVQALTGDTRRAGVGTSGSLNLTRNITPRIMLGGSYFYTDDGFNSAVTGRHRVGLDLAGQIGSLNLSANYAAGLDIDNVSLFANAEWALGPLWRVRGEFTESRYLAFKYTDYSVSVGYRIGWREVGLIYTLQTRTLGLQFLSVNF